MTDQPSLFDSPEQPEPAAEPAGPALDWQVQPVRVCKVTGKPRPQFVWPTNLPAHRPRTYRTGEAATKRAEAKREAQAEHDRKRTARNIAADLDRTQTGEDET